MLLLLLRSRLPRRESATVTWLPGLRVRLGSLAEKAPFAPVTTVLSVCCLLSVAQIVTLTYVPGTGPPPLLVCKELNGTVAVPLIVTESSSRDSRGSSRSPRSRLGTVRKHEACARFARRRPPRRFGAPTGVRPAGKRIPAATISTQRFRYAVRRLSMQSQPDCDTAFEFA